jgi:hypothetical protein
MKYIYIQQTIVQHLQILMCHISFICVKSNAILLPDPLKSQVTETHNSNSVTNLGASFASVTYHSGPPS